MAWKYMIVNYPLSSEMEEAAKGEVDTFEPTMVGDNKCVVKYWDENKNGSERVKPVKFGKISIPYHKNDLEKIEAYKESEKAYRDKTKEVK